MSKNFISSLTLNTIKIRKCIFSVFRLALLFVTFTIYAQQQTEFSCNETMYIVNNDVLYSYTGDETPDVICSGLGTGTSLNALGYSSKNSLLWAFDQTMQKVVTIGANCTKSVIEIPNLPLGGQDYNVGAIDANGYYYLYNGQGSARFYIIDTDPSRATFGKLVDPSNGFTEDMRNPKGTAIQPTGNGANRRYFSDWTIGTDGFLYTILNKNSNNNFNGTDHSFRVVRYNAVTGVLENVTSPVSGGGIQQCNNSNSFSFGAIFRDNTGKLFAFQNCSGQLYRIDGNTATQISSGGGFSTNNVDGAFCPTANLPQPVKFLSFETHKNGSVADLAWITASELGNKGFEVEQSTDAKTWKTIGYVDSRAENGDSDSDLTYTFTDHNPVHGYNYYRLKQIDLDGTFDYSLMRVVIFGEENAGKVIVFPNPTSLYVTITELKGNENINIYDVSGRKIKSAISTSSTTDISLEGLKEGIYHIQINGQNGEVSSHKIVKNN
jgi:hypothetical protein